MLIRPLLGGVLALAVAVGIGRFAYTPILRAMQRGAHLATGPAGLLASANYLGYLAGALLAVFVPGGVVRDRMLIGSLFVVVLTTGLMAGTVDVVAWGILRLLCGLASAAAFVLASDVVLNYLRRRRATELSGWLYSGVGLGIAVSGVVVRVVDAAHGWRGDWLAVGLLAAVLTAAACWLLPRTDTANAMTAELSSQPMCRYRPPFVGALLLGAYLLAGAGYVVTGTFLVVIVDGTTGLGGSGANAWILVGLAAGPSCIAWTWLAARIGYAPALVLAYLGQACSIALPVLGGAAVVMAAAVLFGATAIGIVTLTLTFSGEVAPRGALGSIGLLTAAFGLGQIVGPVLGGLLPERTQSFVPALEAASALVLIGGLLMLVLLLGAARPPATATTKGACCS